MTKSDIISVVARSMKARRDCYGCIIMTPELERAIEKYIKEDGYGITRKFNRHTKR
jgi:hypothetical protein